ncbi:MAG: hypothetical protein SVS15_10905, partial [Thermodesulfobacteriota bacterium]|nr:hypothetical protein [Thermodesulfobacteriota bacterium]
GGGKLFLCITIFNKINRDIQYLFQYKSRQPIKVVYTKGAYKGYFTGELSSVARFQKCGCRKKGENSRQGPGPYAGKERE